MSDFGQDDVEPVRTPSGIGRIRLIIDDLGPNPPPGATGEPQAQYQGAHEVQVLAQDGTVMKIKSGDLTPYLTAAQKTAIKNLQDAFRVKAQNLLPGG